MNLKKYGSKLPDKMLKFLKNKKEITGISVWRLIYDAIKKFYPEYKDIKK